MAILKIDPVTGESLDKAKSPEQVARDQAANEKFYNERKKRALSKSKKKPERVKYEPIVIIDPINSPNNEPSVEELIESFNKLLDSSESFLRKESKKYSNVKLDDTPYGLNLNKPKNTLKVNYDSDLTTYKHIPKDIEYFPTISVTASNYDTFHSEPKVEEGIKRFLYVDRVMFNALDVKTLLKTPSKSKIILANLIKKMYTGKTVASIAIPGEKKKYCLNYKDEFIELRLFSDITEVIGT